MEGDENLEMMSSWTLIKTSNKEEVSEFCPETNQSAEESDGISVISESEICKQVANESENEIEKTSSEVEDEKVEKEDLKLQDELPPTPPLTPSIEDIKESSREFFEDRSSANNVNISKILLIGAGIFVLFSFLYSHVNQLKVEVAKLDQRIVKLEEENQNLKKNLMKSEKVEETLKFHELESEIDNQPQLKSVWLGNEEEEKVEILDNREKLPDFCYFTDKDDLFYEYNLENCDRKKRKLQEKTRKRKPKRNYDEFIQETLQSFNDEIHEIKRKRSEAQNDEIIQIATGFQILDETSEEFPKRNKRKKLRKEERQRNWIQDRMAGREELRKKTIEEQESGQNWYLKRKLERELDRLEVY